MILKKKKLVNITFTKSANKIKLSIILQFLFFNHSTASSSHAPCRMNLCPALLWNWNLWHVSYPFSLVSVHLYRCASPTASFVMISANEMRVESCKLVLHMYVYTHCGIKYYFKNWLNGFFFLRFTRIWLLSLSRSCVASAHGTL